MIVIPISIMVFIYVLTKPDLGGYRECEKLTGVTNLKAFAPHKRPFWIWNPFGHPKYRFYMPRANFDGFKALTQDLGYEEWREVGRKYEIEGQFGSFYEYSYQNNKLYFTYMRVTGSVSCKFFYRPNTERLHAVVFLH